MRLAYKGFNKDLTCTMGNGTFQYKPGVWYKEEKAHCARAGFHATDTCYSSAGQKNRILHGIHWK